MPRGSHSFKFQLKIVYPQKKLQDNTLNQQPKEKQPFKTSEEFEASKAMKVNVEQSGANPTVEADKHETVNMNSEKLNRRLTGWKRLWIFSSAIWLLALFAFEISEQRFPMPVSTEHRAEFYEKMSQESRSLIADKYNSTAQETFNLEFPNQHVMSIIGANDPVDPRHNKMGIEYWSAVEHYTWERRAIYIVKFILTWAIPCLFVYILGMGIRWVYIGFKSK